MPTTHKEVENLILKSVIVNGEHGSRHIFIENRYAYPQFFPMVSTNSSIHSVGTCKSNRKVSDSDSFNMENNYERGIFIIWCDRRLGISWISCDGRSLKLFQFSAQS